MGEVPPNVHADLRYAGVVATLVDASRGTPMIVVGSGRLGAFGRQTLGSVSSGLLHHVHCPVAIIHDPDAGQREIRDDAPVLVDIDGLPASEAAAALAFDEASRRRVSRLALHAWSDVGVFQIRDGDEVLGERLAGRREIYPDVQVHRRLIYDVPARWLVDESKSAQLVVLGSRGRGGFDGLRLGSVSSAAAQSARVLVMVVRGGD
jgi:nucleotide-binding universal stress UspA family protein